MNPAPASPSILCVHQGYDLYGSDRTFLQSLRALRRRFPGARIAAVLPGPGALLPHVARLVDSVELIDLQVIRRGHLLEMGSAKVVSSVRRAIRMINRHDLTYINTTVVFDFIFGARFARGKSVIHVHELPTGVERLAFSGLLAASGATLIFNSEATRKAFFLPSWRRRFVVHNGTVAPEAPVATAGEGLENRDLNLLMLGRFNAWKGQSLLVEAIGRLTGERRRRIRVRMVGDAFKGQGRYLDGVRQAIATAGLADRISIEPFVDDPSGLYAWADLVVVPSTRPEPFGMVAIEAMAHGRPVIGADHGGLREIVQDGKTGALCIPGDPRSLADSIARYRDDPAVVVAHGEAASGRFRRCFDENAYLDSIGTIAAAAVSRPIDGVR